MFKGLSPSQIQYSSGFINKLNPKIPILAEILNDAGYQTFCYSENPWISKSYGVTRGFKVVMDSWKDAPSIMKDNIRLNQFKKGLDRIELIIKRVFRFRYLLTFFQIIKSKTMRSIEKIIKNIQWTSILFHTNTLKDLNDFCQTLKNSQDNDKPFFIFFNIMATHDPYITPINVLNKLNIKLSEVRKVRKFLLNQQEYFYKNNIRLKRISNKKVKTIQKLYNACVYYADFIVKNIIKQIKNLKILKNTIIMISSDHGEHLFSKDDHYLWSHRTFISVYDSLVKVPLIIYNNSISRREISNQVEMKDIFYTILKIANIQETKYNTFKPEKSIIYQLKMNTMPEFIYGEYIESIEDIYKIIRNRLGINSKQYYKSLNSVLFKKLLCKSKSFLRTDKNKYINYGNKFEEFFNIRDDPNELKSISHRNSDIERFRQKLKDFSRISTEIKEIKDIILRKKKNYLKEESALRNFQEYELVYAIIYKS